MVVEDDSAVDAADGVVLDDVSTCHPGVDPVFPGVNEADNYHSRILRVLMGLVEHLEESCYSLLRVVLNFRFQLRLVVAVVVR